MRKTQHDEPRASQTAGAGDGSVPFEGKDVHIEGYIRRQKIAVKGLTALYHNKHNTHSRNDENT